MRIVLDVMGGDRPPIELVRGGVNSARRHDLELLFVGDPECIASALDSCGVAGSPQFEVLPADQVIAMDERPVQAVRAKRRSSMIVGLEALRDGHVDAFVSPGNTGAIVAGSLFTLGRLPTIPRPGLAAILPSVEGREFTLIDVGATVDCAPEHLLHFALMGATHARSVLGVDDPTVAVLSIGEERGKGNRLVARATALLDDAPFRFVGNVEGHQILLDRPADVVVADGFAGNVLVKGIEGGVQATTALLKASIAARWKHKLGALLLRRAFADLRAALGYHARGGAPLLGVRGQVVIAHGRSDATAIAGAIDMARRAVRGRVVEQLMHGLEGWERNGS